MHVVDKTSKELARIALDANITLQTVLTEKAQKFEVHLKEIDRLLEAQEVEDEPESEVAIPGSKRAVGLFPSSEFLNPISPFYDDASRRNTYIMNTHPRPMKEKDLEALANAVKKENGRLQALHRSSLMSFPAAKSEADTSSDTINNLDGLDWDRIAERVSDVSSVKRTATECLVTWVANRPCANHAPWTPSELQQLHSLVLGYPPNKVNWVEVAEKLGTNRIPIDCMRQRIHPQRHYWTPDADQRLTKAVETYGIDNWHLVARKVDEHVTPAQCQARWCKTLDPSLRRGAWTEEEDNQLRKAVAGYGTSWVQVASAVPGRTNDQCRERWTECLNVGPRQSWTDEEDKILIASVAEFGGKWKEISLKVGNNKTGQACRRRYDKLKKSQKIDAISPPTLTVGSMSSFAAQTSTMSISQEPALILTKSDAGSTQSASKVVPATGAVPKPQPHPRPRKKGIATGPSCAGESGVFVEAPESTPASTSAMSQTQKIASKNVETAEANHTSVGIGLERSLPGPSANSPSGSTRTDSLMGKRKRKAAGNAEAASSSKKTRHTRSETKGSTTEKSLIQTGVDTAATAAGDTKADTEVVKPRRGRSTGKGR